MTLESRYKITDKLGDGSFGAVYKGVSFADGHIVSIFSLKSLLTIHFNGRQVAIKKMKNRFANWDECLALREVKSLRQFNDHQNVVKLKEVVRERDGTLYLVFEYMEGNLYQLMKNQNGVPFSESQIKSIIHQILLGLAHIHKYGFFHRDMKPENLLTRQTSVKIADFGLAREIRSIPPYTEYVSTRWYRAPEIVLHSAYYSSPVDIWAVGCIFAELYNLKPLFPGTGEIDQLFKICNILGPPEMDSSFKQPRTKKTWESLKQRSQMQAGGLWNDGHKLASKLGIKFAPSSSIGFERIVPSACTEALDLLTEMLRYDPAQRPTAQECLNHPFFNDLNIVSTPSLPLKSSNSLGAVTNKQSPLILKSSASTGTPFIQSAYNSPISLSITSSPHQKLPSLSSFSSATGKYLDNTHITAKLKQRTDSLEEFDFDLDQALNEISKPIQRKPVSKELYVQAKKNALHQSSEISEIDSLLTEIENMDSSRKSSLKPEKPLFNSPKTNLQKDIGLMELQGRKISIGASKPLFPPIGSKDISPSPRKSKIFHVFRYKD